MKTREEVDGLKADWTRDPCWDLVDSEGFEEYREELAQYENKMKAIWAQQRRERVFDAAHRYGFVRDISRGMGVHAVVTGGHIDETKFGEAMLALEARFDGIATLLDEKDNVISELEGKIGSLQSAVRGLNNRTQDLV